MSGCILIYRGIISDIVNDVSLLPLRFGILLSLTVSPATKYHCIYT